MPDKPYMNVTNVTNPTYVSLNSSHSASVTTLTVECESHSLDLGDSITARIGYNGSGPIVFTGYVKNITKKVPDKTYEITAFDVLTRAIDYFLVSDNPDNPFTRKNIRAEDLVEDLLAEAQLTDFDGGSTSFRFGIRAPVEVNLVSVFDYCKMVADLLTWNLWATTGGTVKFKNRKPHVMVAGSPESSQPGFVADSVLKEVNNATILTLNHTKSEKDLRNRIVVYGSDGVYASSSSSTTLDPDTGGYVAVLPGGYYKSAALATYIIDSDSMAEKTADYNLKLLNRLSIELSMSVIGDPDLMARNVIKVIEPITGVNANYYIFSAEHNVGADGYVVNMLLRK